MGESEVRQRKEEKSEEAPKTDEKPSVCETSGNFQTNAAPLFKPKVSIEAKTVFNH